MQLLAVLFASAAISIEVNQMDVIDRINQAMTTLRRLGVEVRFEDMQGTSSGLCKVQGKHVLVIEVSLPSIEQLEIFEATIKQLRQSKSQAA